MDSFAIGIDIGGTNTVIGSVDSTGRVLHRASVRTAGYAGITAYIEALCHMAGQLEGGLQHCTGVGIGAPNASHYTGEIVDAANLPWKGHIPLRTLLQDRLGLPVTITNDANAAAMGEMRYGAARGMRDFMVITLGTGVGSGIVCNGQLLYGHDGFAGELGHVIVRPDGRQCGCGRKGCLETYCSASGVARTARQMLSCPDCKSVLLKKKLEEITSKDIFDAAIKGDATACRIFEETGTLLGWALANFVAFSSPEAIILFGGLALAGDLLFEPARRAMEENVLSVYRGGTALLPSAVPAQDAAILGAAALAWEERK